MKSRKRKKALKKGFDLINYSVFRKCCPFLAGKPGARLSPRERKAIWVDLREMHQAAIMLRDAVEGVD